jgi:predicted adenine nucleotide alpha hydrolase (AANH) superfamily ATPase
LREEGYNQIIGFFYNPNIHPFKEYKKRIEIAYQVAKILNFELIEAEYDKDNWFKLTDSLKQEPEGGKRCWVCFKLRLGKTYEKAKQLNIQLFTTTLTVSPKKNALLINKIGKEIAPEYFLAEDFKKKDGFKKAMEFSKKYNLYRQNYCGCLYSRKSKTFST